MKRILILLCLPLLFTTCKKEEDNTPTNNNSNTENLLLGSWQMIEGVNEDNLMHISTVYVH
jgi:hypothetical protein